jgi:hypothetical protein
MPAKAKKAPTGRPRNVAPDITRAVDRHLDTLAHRERPLIDALRRVIARAVPKASESVKWNAPSFALSEHFATLNLRAKAGIQLVLHLGAAKRLDIDLRTDVAMQGTILEWKSADRALVTIRDAAHLKAIQPALTRLLKAWGRHVR